MDQHAYPVQFSVDYPDRQLDRVSTLLRLIYVIPIAIVLQTVSGGATSWGSWDSTGDSNTKVVAFGAGGLLIFGPLIMILFRQKYPRWWFDFNLELQRFSSRVGAYAFLMDDRYPSTDDHQSVHVDWVYPDVPRDLNRWFPLIKWFLAIPHYFVLAILYFAVFFALIIAWFAILFTGRYPRALFNFVEGVFRWTNRVVGYAITLVTDEYPPFRLSA